MSMDRRNFLRVAGLGAIAAAGVEATGALGGKLVRLPAAEPLTAKRWAMVVDLKACAEQGVEKSLAACRRAHNIPNIEDPKRIVKWIWSEEYRHAFPDQVHAHLTKELAESPLPVLCNHCDSPPCTRVCPTQATWKREDGIVMMDWHRCIGCRYCIAACPYGSRSFNWSDPREHLDEVNPRFPTREKGVVEKCNFCEERLAEGQLPACVAACEGDEHPAMTFGDLDDPDSSVRQLLRERHAIRRKPGLGTEPEVYYLV